MTQPQVIYAISHKQTPAFPPRSVDNDRDRELVDFALEICLWCWSTDPAQRPTMGTLLNECFKHGLIGTVDSISVGNPDQLAKELEESIDGALNLVRIGGNYLLKALSEFLTN